MSTLENLRTSFSSKTFILIGFLIPPIYWLYLLFATHPVIVFDSIGYEQLGRMIFNEGWAAFFTNGPNREPLYPAIIALSMFLENIFSYSYIAFQKSFQIACLFLSQILLYKVLKSMRTSNWSIGLTVLYCGVSPALVNSALSLFSEIITYPLILGLVLVLKDIWQKPQNKNFFQLVGQALSLGFLSILLISSKAIFEYILICLAIIFIGKAIYLFLKKRLLLPLSMSMIIITAALIVFGFLHTYKNLNYKYNGNYTFTNRGALMLYGSVEKRLIPFTGQNLLAATLMIPGDGVCAKFLPNKSCRHWLFKTSDHLGITKFKKLLNDGQTEAQANEYLLKQSLKRIQNHPFQYSLFHVLESLRMVFWESTMIGFVDYPQWLDHLFRWPIFKDSLRLCIGMLTAVSLLVSLMHVIRHKNQLIAASDQNTNSVSILFISLLIMMFFIGAHGFFSILNRYSFPIAPLYFLCIAHSLDAFYFATINKSNRNQKKID